MKLLNFSLHNLAVAAAVVLGFAGGFHASQGQAAPSNRATTFTPAPVKKEPVDVNNADAKTLETLPGIGAALADKIIAGRPYRGLADLKKVKGLSASKIDAIKDDVTFATAVGSTRQLPNRSIAQKERTAREEKAARESKTSEAKGGTAGSSTETRQGTFERPSVPAAPRGRTTTSVAPGQRININTATAEELDALPGIGPVRAQAILDYRKQHGNFKSIEEIENVKGIKEGEFSRIKDRITVRE